MENKNEQLVIAAEKLYKKYPKKAGKLWYDYLIHVKGIAVNRESWIIHKSLKLI